MEQAAPITAETWIEDLVREHTFAVEFLRTHGIRCLACGEPVWGTLAEAAREKGKTEADIAELVAELNRLAEAEAAR